MKKKIAVTAGVLGLVLLLTGCGNKTANQNQNQNQNQAKQQGAGPQDGQGQQKGMPEEMKTACADKNEGDACETSMPKRDSEESEKVSGTCQKGQNSDDLVCRPDNMPERPEGSPTQK